MTYDDRLDGHDTVDSLMDTAETIVEELAEQHFEECYRDEVCSMCADDTPLSKTNGQWIGKAADVDDLEAAVEDRVAALGDDPHWVAAHLSGRYFETFREQGAPPEECVICTAEIVSEDDDCGHELVGQTCPVRE